jgi:hypothetical protein
VTRGRLLVALSALAAVAAVGLSYWALFVRSPQTAVTAPGPALPAPTAPAPAPAMTLTLSELTSPVEIAGVDGVWRTAKPGDTLTAAMRVRTGDGGAATLTAPGPDGGSTVKLRGATSVSVQSLTRELSRLSLGAGMVEADVRDDPSRLLQLDLDQPGAGGQEIPGAATARTRGAAFVASSDGAGRSSVATRRGEVILSARGKEVTIHTGEFARVAPGEAPSPPSAIPPSLFLKVAWPSASSRKKEVVVSGEAAPGTRIAVEGKFIHVDPAGRYQGKLTLGDGTHELRLEATDLAGRTQRERSPPITIDSSTDFKAQKPKWGQ